MIDLKEVTYVCLKDQSLPEQSTYVSHGVSTGNRSTHANSPHGQNHIHPEYLSVRKTTVPTNTGRAVCHLQTKG